MRLLPLLLFAVACRPPPEAPDALDELAAYIYAHHADEDPAAEQDALTKLSTWLEENWGEAEEGYEIGALEESTADGVDDEDRDTEDMIGLAVPTASAHSVDGAAYAMVAVPESEVYPEMFFDYTREDFGDVDCFLAHDCARMESREHMESHFPLGIVSISQAYDQYLWVELEAGPAFVQRNWLEYPPDVSGPLTSLIEVDEQFYLNLFMPRPEGFWRLQATWMVFTQSSVDDDIAKNMAITNMQDNSLILDEYLTSLSPDALPEEQGCASVPARPGRGLGWLVVVAGLLVGWRRRR